MEEAAVCEPMSAGVRGLTQRHAIQTGDRVLVCGAGPIALLAAAVAHAEGAQVILCGLNIDRKRLAIAQNMGIVADAINLEEDDLTATVNRVTHGESMDIVVECAGAPASLVNCLKHVRKGGTLIQIGIYAKPFEVDFSQLVMNELQFIGVYGHVWSTWEKSLALMRDKKVDVRPLITHILPMAQWKEGLDAIHNGDAIKVLLKPV